MPNQKTRHRQLHLVTWLGVLILVFYLLFLLTSPAPVVPRINFKGTVTPVAKVNLAWPSYGEGSIGAIGYGVLVDHENQKPMPTASIAKVMTALAVLHQRPLSVGDDGPIITIGAADIASYQKFIALDGSVVGVANGEQITEYQALEAMLLPSANNMAETLARWAFGSINAYNSYATNYAHQLGLKSVTITDPSGFSPSTIATAHDLTLLGELAMQNPVIAQIVSTPSATIPVQGTIQNYNLLLGQNGNVGIKTGNNDQDTGAYLFAYKLPVGNSNVMVVGTLMGGPDLLTVLRDTRLLVQSMQNYFEEVNFVNQGQVVGSYQVPGHTPVNAVASQDISLVVWQGYAFVSQTSLQSITGKSASQATVGSIAVTNMHDHHSNSVPATLQTALPAPSWHYRLTHWHF